MNQEPTSPIKYVTECRICRQKFLASAFVPIVGNKPDERILAFGMELFNHMLKKHQRELGAFLIVTAYSLTDPILIKTFDPLRYAVHRNTAKNFVPDAQIQDRLAGIGVDTEMMQKILPLFSDLRDFLCESGRYGIEQQPAAPLVTV